MRLLQKIYLLIMHVYLKLQTSAQIHLIVDMMGFVTLGLVYIVMIFLQEHYT